MNAEGKEGPVYSLRVERCCEGAGEIEREEGERNAKGDFERGRDWGKGEPNESCVWRRSREVKLYTRTEMNKFMEARRPFFFTSESVGCK